MVQSRTSVGPLLVVAAALAVMLGAAVVDAQCPGVVSPALAIGPNPQPTANPDFHYQNIATRGYNCCPTQPLLKSCFPTRGMRYPTNDPSPMFPYGPNVGDNQNLVPICDDCSSTAISLINLGGTGKDYRITFFGKPYTSFFISNNGIISFNSGVSAWTGQPMPYSSNPMLAAFWADIDTRGANSGRVWYRPVTDPVLLVNYTETIRSSFLGTNRFQPYLAIVVTWSAVGYYAAQTDKLNTFQCVLVTDGTQTYSMFNYGYKAQQWDRGQASPSTSFAQVGFDAGDSVNFFNAVGTRTSSMRDLWFLTAAVPAFRGRQVYRIDGAQILPSPTFLSPIANLSNLVLNGGYILTPAFSPTIYSYTTAVLPGFALTLTPTQAVVGQAIRIGDSVPAAAPVASGSPSTAFPITIATSLFAVVLAPDTIREVTYTVAVQVLPSTESKLTALAASGYTFNEGPFNTAGTTLSYSLSVTSAVNSITFTATSLDQFASIRMRSYGPSVQNLVASNVPLVNGANVFVFNCTAQNSNFFRLYTVTVTRVPSSDTQLASLTAAPFTVTNASNVFSLTVGATDNSVTLVATAFWQSSSISINGGAYVLTSSSTLIGGLAFGANVITVNVRAEAGAPIQSYTVTITRLTSTDSSLSSLTLTTDLGYPLTLSSAFSPGTTAYTVTTQSWTVGVIARAALTDLSFARMTLNLVALGNNAASSVITLTPSLVNAQITVLTFRTTAQNTAFQTTYTVIVTRPPPPVIIAAASPLCGTLSFDINRNELLSFRIDTTAAGGEILHVDAVSNITSIGGAQLWLQRGSLPNTGSTLGVGFIASSQPADRWSSATLMYMAAANDYFLSVVPGAAASVVKEFRITLNVCTYTPTNVPLSSTVNSTVDRNRWAFFSTTPSASQTLPGLEFRTGVYTTVPDINQQYLRSFSRQSATGSDTDAGTFFGAVADASNPFPNLKIFGSSVSAPTANVRVLYGIFGVSDGTAITGVPLTLSFGVSAVPTRPVIANVAPRNGGTGGGNVITITLQTDTGEPLVNQAVVNGQASIGGVPCTALSYDSQSRLLCTVPAGQGSGLPIAVTLYTLQSPAFVQTYSYDPPSLTTPTWTVAPTIGNALLTINGNNFGATATATVGGQPCPVQTRTPNTKLICLTPPGEGTQVIAVNAAGQASTNTRSYVYDGPTLITSAASNTATAGGNPITIIGTNFGRNQTTGPLTVTIGSNPCSNPVSNQTVIQCTLPAGAGLSQAIVVTVAGVSGGGISFNYGAPVLSSITPNPVPVLATTLTIRGSQFGSAPTSLVVTALGGTCNPTFRNDTYITCTVPARSVGLPPAPFVTVGGQQSNTLSSLLWATPVITAISPQILNTAGNQQVMITGTDLLGAAGDFLVRFNGIDLSPNASSNANAAYFTSPTNNPAGLLVPVLMVVGGQSSNTVFVNYTRPSISGVTYSSGSGPFPDGTATAIVSGLNFGPTGLVLLSNGQTCTSTVWTSTSITCTVPPGVGPVTMTVTVAGQTSLPFGVTYLAPQITSLSPTDPLGVSTAGGDTLQINGRNFGVNQGAGGSVTIRVGTGQVLPCNVAGWSDTVISCATPPGNGTLLTVTVTQTSLFGTRSTFSYNAPVIQTVTASSFPTAGGTTLIISGTSVDTFGSVTVNGTACTPITQWSNALGQIQCTLPVGGGASNPVVVSTIGGRVSAPFFISYSVPSIVSISPTTLTTAGQQLILQGSNLGNKASLASVTVAGLGGNTVTFNNHTHLIFTLGSTPQSASAPIVVTYAGLTAAGFTVGLSAPIIYSLNPPNGPTGPTYNCTINGQFFGDGTRPTSVAFGGANCPILSLRDNQIVCAVPAGVDSQLVQVTVGTQPSNTLAFQYDRPSITSVTPNTGLPTQGNVFVTVRGTSFGASGAQVFLGGVLLAVSEVSNQNHTYLLFRLPAGVGSGIIVSVRQSSQTSIETTTTVSYAGPTLTNVSPSTGPTDGCTNCLALTGSGFGPGGAQAGVVTVGGQSCAVQLATYSDSSVTCSLPAGSGAGLTVVITVNGVPSNGFPFRYTSPVISGITVQGTASPAGGSSVFIAGTNFGTTGTVSVNGTLTCSVSNPSWWTSTLIQCQMPASVGNVVLVVTVGGQQSNGFIYRYAAPTLTGPVPSNGPTIGGTVIVVNGNNLGSAGTLTIGGLPCTPINTGWTNTRVECTTPPGPGGSPSTILVTVGGQTATSSFTWDDPVVFAVEPQPIATIGGTGQLVVRGINFGAPASPLTVSINSGSPVTAASHNHTHAIVLNNIPAGTGAGLSIQVRTNGGNLSPLNTFFSYRAPSITSITSASCTVSGNTIINCPTAGGYNITVNGADFGFASPAASAGAVSILINSVPTPCANPEYIGTTGTAIRCRMPAGLSFGLPVTVLVNGQTSNAVNVAYAGPILTPNTLRLTGSGSGASTLLLPSINGTQNITIGGQFLGPFGTPLARFGTVGLAPAAKEYACNGAGVLGVSQFACVVQSLAVGAGLSFVYWDGQQWSPESTDLLSFPAPQFVPGTIRRPAGVAGSTFVGSSSQGEFVQFAVRHVGNDASKLTVQYDLSGGAFDQANQNCGSVSIVTPFSSQTGFTYLQCRTQPGTSGPYVFKIRALNQWSAESTDTYSYPTAPVVLRVLGGGACRNNTVTNSTFNCPTIGQVQLTLIGTAFQPDPADNQVLVGIRPCPVTSASATQLVCTLPAGTGQNVPVTVFSGQYASIPVNRVSYALATINSVQGCAINTATSTSSCVRTGGDLITISGTGFGPSGAFVFVGASRCTNIAHSSDTTITCNAPAGTAVNSEVLVVQASGTLSGNTGSLSYVQCAPGRFQASPTDYACTLCAAGSFTDLAGLSACKPCPLGTATNSTGQSSCQPCALGSFAASTGKNVCDPCAQGTFTNTQGQAVCQACPAQTFAFGTGNTGCTPCPAGQSSTATAATSCANCTAGYYTPTAGAGDCQACPPGTFNTVPGSTACTLCAPGFVQPASAQTVCTACNPGFFVGLSGQVACPACESGTFSNGTGLSFCYTCPAGQWSKKSGTQGAVSCTRCAAGSYLDVAGQSDCLQCPKGRFAPGTGATLCDPCPLGTIASSLGLTACANCTAGSVATATGLDVCSTCPSGTFSAAPGSSACSQCAIGSYNSNPGATFCQLCGVGGSGLGTFGPSTGQALCVPCDAGFFQDQTGRSSCVPCSIGRFAASSQSSTCTACPAGQFSPAPAAAGCTPCPAGQAVNATGQGSCAPCAPGAISAQGANLCTACPAGQFAPQPGSATCQACPVGTFTNTSGNAACQVCPPGTQQPSTGATACTACVRGFYSLLSGQASCFPCPIGTIAAAFGSSSCAQCGTGTFAPSTASSACLQCAPGSSTPSTGQASCPSCLVGTAAPAPGLATCSACLKGSFASGVNASQCTPCVPGTFAPTDGAVLCTPCPVGQFQSNSGRTACSLCPAGSVQPQPGQASCSLCGVGAVQPNAGQVACTACPVGQFAPAQNMTTCALCAAGTANGLTGQAGCTQCARGTFSSVSGAAGCTPCPPGSIHNNVTFTSCTPCPVGTARAQPGSSFCDACPVGTFNAVPGSAFCQGCPAGSYADVPGLSQCKPCPVGFACPANSVTPTACGLPAATISPAQGQAQCTQCSPGTFVNATAQSTCWLCDAGTFSGDGSVMFPGATACTNCAAGKISAARGLPVCDDCPSGTFQAAAGKSRCTQCSAGFFQPGQGLTQCTPASAGFFVPLPGQAAQSLCPFGTFSVGSNNTGCTQCPRGSVQNTGSVLTPPTACTACGQGFYSPTPGQQNCLRCDAGTFSNSTAMTSCFLAPVGTFSGAGAASATPCAVGTYAAVAGSAQCLPCPARSFSNLLGTVNCQPCPPGTFGNETGLATCRPCDLGSFSDTPGSFQCTPCQPGAFQDLGNQQSCKPCPVGQFSDDLAQVTCDSCPAGQFASNLGSVSCSPCPVGTFAPTSGSGNCSACGIGKFQNQTGRLDCVDCAPGSSNPVVGQVVCPLCAVGTVAPTAGLPICQKCPPGFFMNTEGQVACRACDLGKFNRDLAATVCLDCDRGTFMNQTQANFTCFACDAGKFQAVAGQSTCGVCAPGSISTGTGASVCSQCEPGRFGTPNDTVSCTDCPAGSRQPGFGQFQCDLCPVGKTSKPSAADCTDCPSGTIAAANGTTECLYCDSGLFQALSGQSSCELCQPGKFSVNDTKQLSDCPRCAPGTASNVTGLSTPCPQCRAGYFTASAGRTACSMCEPGKYLNNPPSGGATTCDKCPVGTYSNTFGVGFDAVIVNGSVVGGECTPCPAGTFNAETGKTACDPCPVGTASNIAFAQACSACPAGSYAPVQGLTGCSLCPPGNFSNANTAIKSSCAPCAPGTHAPGNGTDTCQDCPVGYYAPGYGFQECVACETGRFTSILRSTDCTSCRVGTYQDSQHATFCKSCDIGSANNKTGQAECVPCAAGAFQPSTDQTGCSRCDNGTFVAVPGQGACLSCPAGSYAPSRGSTECFACAPGRFAPVSGGVTCAPCAPGTFSTGSARVCPRCGERQVAPDPAAFECYACDVHATTDEARTKCLCEVGYAAQYSINNRTGIREATCVLCPKGAVCDTVGTDFDTMQRARGYWCAEPGTYYQCLIETDCPQGPCATPTCSTGDDTCTSCANGRTGPLCAYCLDGWTEDSQGKCNQCAADKTSSYVYTILIIALFAALLVIGCYIMVDTSSAMMDIAAREDEKMRLKAEGYIQNFNEGFLDDQWRFGRYITLRGAPPPKPDFTFKLKIVLGFVQIITNLAVGLQIQWPTAFKAFLETMNPANLDFVKFSSIDCLRRPSYYDQLVLFALVPPLLVLLLILFYFIPHTCRNLASNTEGRVWRKRVRRNFWKLLLFLLFLVYPTVAATVLRLYVCIDVQGTSYLRADLTTQCYTDTWNRAAFGNLILVVLYPILVPVFFLAMLLRYRKRLDQSGVRAAFGFLYDGYERSFYLFELVDMVHKLGITSLVAFLPDSYQLPVAMAWVTAYLLIILLGKPYIRKGDDILHLFVQVEILLLIMAGYVFTTLSVPDKLMDTVLSIVLIVAVCGLFLYFLLSAFNVFWKWLRHTQCGQRFAFIRGKEDDVTQTVASGDAGAGAAPQDGGSKKKGKRVKKVDNSIGGEMKRVYRIDRHTLRQHGRVATARGQAEDDAAIAMVRNSAWGDAELAKTRFSAAEGDADAAKRMELLKAAVGPGTSSSPHAATTRAPADSVSPRRAALEARLAAGGDAPAPAAAPARGGDVELSPLNPAPAQPLETLQYSAPAPLASEPAAPVPVPVPVPVEPARSSVADLAQPLGTTPASAPTAIEMQPVVAAPAPVPAVAPAAAEPAAAASSVPEPSVRAEPEVSAVAAVPEASAVAAVPEVSAVAPIPSYQPISLEPIAPMTSAVAEPPAAGALPDPTQPNNN